MEKKQLGGFPFSSSFLDCDDISIICRCKTFPSRWKEWAWSMDAYRVRDPRIPLKNQLKMRCLWRVKAKAHSPNRWAVSIKKFCHLPTNEDGFAVPKPDEWMSKVGRSWVRSKRGQYSNPFVDFSRKRGHCVVGGQQPRISGLLKSR